MTGVEAVSNGVTAFREPTVNTARRTITVIIAILIAMLAGIGYLVRTYHVVATEPGQPGYESILSQLIGAVLVVLSSPFRYVVGQLWIMR